MPSYSVLSNHLADTGVTSTATFTANGHVVTTTNVANFGEMFKHTQIENVKVKITTAPAAGSASTKLRFLNGTATFATVDVGTNTAGVVLDATMTPSNARIAEGVEPTLTVIGTGTASSTTGVAQGTYDVWFEM